jgi:hypothetical protein
MANLSAPPLVRPADRSDDGEPSGATGARGIMAYKPQDLWYVSFELPRGKRPFARGTKTFPNEREAKQFARAKSDHTLNITAGTLNPHLPKRTIAPMQIPEWIEGPNEAGLT